MPRENRGRRRREEELGELQKRQLRVNVEQTGGSSDCSQLSLHYTNTHTHTPPIRGTATTFHASEERRRGRSAVSPQLACRKLFENPLPAPRTGVNLIRPRPGCGGAGAEGRDSPNKNEEHPYRSCQEEFHRMSGGGRRSCSSAAMPSCPRTSFCSLSSQLPLSPEAEQSLCIC